MLTAFSCHFPTNGSKILKRKTSSLRFPTGEAGADLHLKYCAMDELAFLLWATQGIRQPAGGNLAYRTVPSAGARHSFETYLFVMRVEGIQPGLYRYLPVSNELLFGCEVENMESALLVPASGRVSSPEEQWRLSGRPYRIVWSGATPLRRIGLF